VFARVCVCACARVCVWVWMRAAGWGELDATEQGHPHRCGGAETKAPPPPLPRRVAHPPPPQPPTLPGTPPPPRPCPRKDSWRPEEDARLLELHAQHGTSWSRISQLLKGRTSQQCRARWCAAAAPPASPLRPRQHAHSRVCRPAHMHLRVHCPAWLFEADPLPPQAPDRLGPRPTRRQRGPRRRRRPGVVGRRPAAQGARGALVQFGRER
jgi:hypothetical protein